MYGGRDKLSSATNNLKRFKKMKTRKAEGGVADMCM
jgi:hypothetical protein